MNTPAETEELKSIAAQHARQLNAIPGFSEKWNSASGKFFSTLLTQEQSIRASDLAGILFSLGLHSTDSGFNFSVAAHLLAAVGPIVHHGSNHATAISAINSGSICANAMTESGSGSDSFKMKTVAVRDGDRFSISGSKTFVTNGPVADYFVLYAMTDPQKGFFGGVTCFLLDKQKHRFKAGPAIAKISLKNSPMSELFFEDCEVDEASIIGQEGGGAMIFLESMDWERACMASMHAGTMTRLCNEAADYVKSRIRGDKALSEFQAIQFKIADMAVLAETSRVMALRAAHLVDQKRGTVAAAQAKIMASESFMQAASLAATLRGGNGITTETGLTDVMADAQAALIYSGPNDVLRELIASRL